MPSNLQETQQRMLAVIRDAKSKIEKLENARHEPIAIVGMACKLPGNLNDYNELWNFLAEGKDAVEELPKNRWDSTHFEKSSNNGAGTIKTSKGCFLEEIDLFDPVFFGISSREAKAMDPQHRLLLESTWHALEDAGIPAQGLKGKSCGIFIGIGQNHYAQKQLFSDTPNHITAHAGTGNLLSFASGRIAYHLGTTGPCVSTDTACSSSMSAIYQAVQSLRNQECDLAIVGGVHLHITPEISVFLSEANVLSPDGQSFAFANNANGFGRGEGCSVLVLQRNSDAIKERKRVHSKIIGVAMNHDGASSSITAPNGEAQEALLEAALKNAKIAAEEIGFIETHGTGTELGDPIEAEALASVYGKGRSNGSKIILGSVKTNIGHLESASGATSLIKATLCVKHGEIPCQPKFETPNQHIAWEDVPIEVAETHRKWNSNRRIAGISSFGFSGTNVHVLIENNTTEYLQENVEESPQTLCFSAKSKNSLKSLAFQYLDLLEKSELPIDQITESALKDRSQYEHRLAIFGKNKQELTFKLNQFVSEGSSKNYSESNEQSLLAFLFTGQGAQYAGMAKEAYETIPLIQKTLEECQEILSEYLETPLLDVMFGKSTEAAALINQTAYTQPCLFSLEYAFAKYWMNQGITPDMLIGHSVGEFAAACLAEVFSLKDGLKLIAMRGKLMQALPAGGKMAVVFAKKSVVEPYLNGLEHLVSIAATNGPENTVISGDGDTLSNLIRALKENEIKSQPLVVSHAFHSPLMDPILDEFRKTVETVEFHDVKIPIVSNLNGKLADEKISTVDYWVEHIRAAVSFDQGMQTLRSSGCHTFLEVGPQPTLCGMGKRCYPDEFGNWLHSIKRGAIEVEEINKTKTHLYLMGHSPVPQTRRYPGCDLPLYPFDHQRYWVEEKNKAPFKQSKGNLPQNYEFPLIGLKCDSPLSTIQFETEWSPNSPDFLNEHIIYGECVVPAAAFVDQMLQAARQQNGKKIWSIEDIYFERALILKDNDSTKIQTVLEEKDYGYDISIFSKASSKTWLRHVSAKIVEGSGEETIAQPNPMVIDQLRASPYDYNKTDKVGISFGPGFKCLSHFLKSENESFSRISLANNRHEDCKNFGIHPMLWDGFFQTIDNELSGFSNENLLLPFRCQKITLYKFGETNFICEATGQETETEDSKTGNVRIWNDDGELVAKITNFEFRVASTQAIMNQKEQVPKLEAESKLNRDAAPQSFIQQIQATEQSKHRDVLRKMITQEVAKILDHPNPNEITPRKRFFDLGLDSILSLELVFNMEEITDLKDLHPTFFMDYPTVEAVENYLLENMPIFVKENPNQPTEKISEKHTNEETIHSMAESDADDLLLQEIERINQL